MPGDFLDVSSDPPEDDTPDIAASGRRFIGIQFRCCGMYARIYINRRGTAYEGRCPRCAKPVRFEIGPGGSDERFFTVS
ncbi:MAG: hypothetical protein AB7O62_25045 [Pirellulales bacterium]